MDTELTGARRPSNGDQQQPGQSTDAAERKATLYEGDGYDDTDDILEQFQRNTVVGFWAFLQSPNVRLFILVIFTLIIMTIGILVVYFCSLPSNEPCQFAFQRTMKSTVVVSSQPRSVAIGDINNDQKIDYVVANSGQNNIGIFISIGNGTFADQQTYSTGSDTRPQSVVISDFNNDKYLDIGVANYGTNNIGIFLGNGNGKFANQKLFSLGSSRPVFLTVADFNKDGQMDIVIATNGTNSISILFGKGNGTFQNQFTYPTGYDSMPYSLAVGDFNKDSQLDIAVANYGTSNVCIFLNYGNGTFKIQQTYTTTVNSNPSSIAVGDFNNDNYLDIVVTNYGIGNIGILFGRSNGSFLAQITYTISNNTNPQYVTVGDLNKDNQLDVIIVDSKNDQVHVLPGYGNGSFATLTTYDGIYGSQPLWAALADFNNNNQTDIVVVNYGTSNTLVLIDYWMKPSARQINYGVGTPSVTSAIAVSDFNGDNIVDILSHTDEDLIILTGLGDGIFSSVPTFSIHIGFNLQYMCVGDLNNDNKTDIIIADISSNNVYVCLGHGDGTFATMTNYSTGDDSSPYWVAVGDVNNDNHMDIISANKGTGTIGIFLGNGHGTFNTMIAYSTGIDSNPSSVALGYINNDNYLDIVVATWTDVVLVFIGNSDGSFTSWETYSTVENSQTSAIALADFNGDSYLDIVISDYNANCIAVFYGYGNGTFTTQTVYPTGSGSLPVNLIVADFTNDSIYDIAVTNQGSDEVIIFYGYSDGSFELARTYSTGSGSKPYGITAADLNNNAQLEMIVALWGPGDVAVLTEYYAADFDNELKYSTGSTLQPYSVAMDDFNKDNRSDIVVAYAGNGSLGIFLATNNGTYDMEVYPIGTDSYPQYVITLDVNNDNYSDIISVNSKIDSISVIKGYGNGQFADQVMYSTGDGSHPFAVSSGYFNNDTRLDLVISNEGTDSIGILFGFNYTTFQSQVSYSNAYSRVPEGMAVSDFNNDGYLDMVVTFNWANAVGVFLGFGDGTFDDTNIYSTGTNSEPWGIAVGDFNNDNQTDFVVTNTNTNTIGVRLGYGNGAFGSRVTYSTGDDSYPIAVAVGDFNNDGQLDVVVANYFSSTVGVLLGYGNGNFSIVQTYSTGQNSYPNSITVADFNNDNQLDIAVANYQTDNVGILFGYGNGTFDDQITFSVGYQSRPSWIIVGDFNRDNQTDIATANWNLNNVGILLGYENRGFTDVMFYSTGAGSLPSCLNLGDFNNDNISDIAVTKFGTNEVVVLFGVGDGTFLLGIPYSTGDGSQPTVLVTGHFNNDSRLDIAVANSHLDNVGVFIADASEPFASVTTYSTGEGSMPHLIATDDLNNDGLSDIVIANYGIDNVNIILGRSSGSSDSGITYSTGSGSAPYSVGIADFNNDTHLDIIVANSGTDNIAILLGYGNGTFAIGTKYSTGASSRPYAVTISDLNNDNILDLAVANSGVSSIFLLYGYGNGTFGNGTSYSLGYGYSPYSVAAGDLNQDHRMDIAIACYGTDHIETLMKLCS